MQMMKMFLSFQCSGLHPYLNDTDIFAEISVPSLQFDGSFIADVRLLSLLGFPSSGDVNFVACKYLYF